MSDIGLLLGDVARLLRRRFEERTRSIGVTRAQWRLLLLLSRHEGLNQGRLANLIEIEPITLGRMIDRMEAAGLVERRSDPSDRRAWRIYLSQRAHPIIEQLSVIANELMEDALDGTSGQERRAIEASLSSIRAILAEPSDMREVDRDAVHKGRFGSTSR